ncbi:hypothetical protein GCM10023328_14240 [Modestobacter marinus]|uniref:Uncharacterized protein n=1 Tax=Modestobacter marinus TaxID=477641 RepID=A0A846LNB1_9ACTN|nr:hypothetical protein [Modestobacter marinus]NIH68941.1 hypothetical protein [Modestobacter marinus]GGL78783.1 hypothetical protein GCM10011589_38580 [Modestobacter marinus]
MTTPLPTGPAGALDVRADDELSWLLSLDSTVLAVLGGVFVTLLLMALLTGWLVVRRVRRSPLVARSRELASRGRELGVQGATAVTARRLPPGQRRTCAELQLEVARSRDRLRRQVAAARAAGAHLGEVPDLLPALEAEGSRLEQRLRQRTQDPQTVCRDEPATEARAYLDTVADVCDAVFQAERVAAPTGRTTADVADAVTALRAHTAAYQELIAPPAMPPLPRPAAGPAPAGTDAGRPHH